jgi:tetratricopeptide (TPR) repeat protein
MSRKQRKAPQKKQDKRQEGPPPAQIEKIWHNPNFEDDLLADEPEDELDDLTPETLLQALPPKLVQELLENIEKLVIGPDPGPSGMIEPLVEKKPPSRKKKFSKMSPREQAEELAAQARESLNPAEPIDLAQEALRLDPDCLDALLMLNECVSGRLEDHLELLRRAVAAGARTLGEELFARERGNFWELTETRPYMNACSDLAELLTYAGRIEEAIVYYRDMLELCPNDNLGNRFYLLCAYLEIGDLEGARGLFSQYPDEICAVFDWGKVLERFLAGGQSEAATALVAARKSNPHLEPYIRGERLAGYEEPPLYQFGSEEEATVYADCVTAAWRPHPAAVVWLRGRTGTVIAPIRPE